MENKHQGSNNFLNGLLLGLVIGAGITLLFTTKKGKKLLRTFSEEGLGSISNMDDLVERFQKVAEKMTQAEEEEEASGNDYIKKEIKKEPVLLAEESETTKKKVTLPTVEINRPEAVESKSLVDAVVAEAVQEAEAEKEEEEVHKVKSTRRRFFRGIHRRG